MNGNDAPIPLIGQKAQQQNLMANQLVVQTYLGLIPVVAAPLLQHTNMYAERDEIPERIADEAWKVTRAAVRKIGINIPEKAPGDQQAEKPGDPEVSGAGS